MKNKKRWIKTTCCLPKDHGWRSKPGYKVFVADKGAVRFNFPATWLLAPGEDGSICFHDRQPPDDNVRLEFSLMRLPPGIDLSELQLAQLFREAVWRGDGRPYISRSGLFEIERTDMELVWAETVFIDPDEKREARSRACLARGRDVLPFVTMDMWSDDLARFAPAWDEMLESLQLGFHIPDPLKYRQDNSY